MIINIRIIIIIYRLEEPQRKRIRLLKASHGSDSDSSSASSQEGTGDRSRAKLGNWFTGKHTIQVKYIFDCLLLMPSPVADDGQEEQPGVPHLCLPGQPG